VHAISLSNCLQAHHFWKRKSRAKTAIKCTGKAKTFAKHGFFYVSQKLFLLDTPFLNLFLIRNKSKTLQHETCINHYCA
jgi:hypothetical protein